jgi:hypothetical protein
VPYGSGPLFLAEVGSGAAICPVAPDHASWLRWTLVQPRVLRLRTSLPRWEGLPCHRMSYGLEPHIPIGEGSSTAMRPATPYGPWASCLKKGIASLLM